MGAYSLILPGVSIGSNSIIGAGSVVTKSFGDNLIIAGNPARVISTVDSYKEKVISLSMNMQNLSGEERKNKILRGPLLHKSKYDDRLFDYRFWLFGFCPSTSTD